MPPVNEPGAAPPSSAPPPSTSHHWAWAAAAVFACLCVLTGFLVYQCSPARQAGEFAGASATGLARLAAAIKQDNIVQTFREHLESVQPDLDGRLLVAEVKANEEFSDEDSNLLGTTSSDIRVPVTYYYYVALSGSWSLVIRTSAGGAVTCLVLAPPIKPLPSPAVDTSHLEIKSENGWLRWNKDEVTANLLREISPKVSARAAQKIPEFFPQARESVEKFVRNWILQEYQLSPQTPVFIQVTFRNETPVPPVGPAGDLPAAPTL